jgi:hypothetical protein
MALCTAGWMGKPCRRNRRCGTCRASWSRMWAWALRENLSLVRGMTRLVTLTAPGADALPWDEEHCRWMGSHRHSGPLGCRIEVEAANRWAADLNERFHRLCMAARMRARVREPVVCARAWEAQNRGAPHCHMVVVVNEAGEAFVDALFELAESYGFGRVHDRGYAAKGGYAHAGYLAKYVTKYGHDETARRVSLLEASLLPRQTVWVSPILTRRSGATLTVARLVRSVWAFAEGFRDALPTFRDETQRAWTYYWRRVAIHGREAIRRSIVPRDWGPYEAWQATSWPGAT